MGTGCPQLQLECGVRVDRPQQRDEKSVVRSTTGNYRDGPQAIRVALGARDYQLGVFMQCLSMSLSETVRDEGQGAS